MARPIAEVRNSFPPQHWRMLVTGVAGGMVRLHHRLRPCQRPDRSSIVECISSRTGSEVAHNVDQELRKHIHLNFAQLVGFRASVVYPFTEDQQPWLVLEWRENDGTEGVAVFDTDDGSDRYSYLIHYGLGRGDPVEGKHWEHSSIAWNVSDLSVLKALFQASHHALGLLEMPKSDAVQLYCFNSSESCNHKSFSTEEYAHFNISG
jgi:hypothetical protein